MGVADGVGQDGSAAKVGGWCKSDLVCLDGGAAVDGLGQRQQGYAIAVGVAIVSKHVDEVIAAIFPNGSCVILGNGRCVENSDNHRSNVIGGGIVLADSDRCGIGHHANRRDPDGDRHRHPLANRQGCD